LRRIPDPDYEHHPAYGAVFGPPSAAMRARAMTALAPHLAYVTLLTLRNMWPPLRRTPPVTGQSIVLLGQLEQDGAAAIQLGDAERSALRDNAQPFVDVLEAKIAGVPPEALTGEQRLLMLKPGEAAPLYRRLGTSLKRTGVLSAAECYLGFPVRIAFVTLVISLPGVRFRQNLFADVGLPDPPTAYMHIDSTLRSLKCIVYLSQVSEHDGPFRYTLGSHVLDIGLWEGIVRRAVHRSGLGSLDLQETMTRARRELFWALPSCCRRKAEFGNDLLADSPEVRLLLERERVFTSADGDLILFDNDGIHRGALAPRSKRIILQVGLHRQ
jgi:hypothetical protein